MKKLILCAILVVTAMLVTTNIHATTLPWLDFGSNMYWDSNTNTLSDGGLSYVNSLTYRDGTIVPPPFFPPSDGILFNQVTFSISFDGSNSNDWINIGSYFYANLDVVGSPIDPLNSAPNPYVVNIASSGLLLDTGNGSQWADEMGDVLNLSLLYPARLNLAWLGSSTDLGNGLYQINANGKVAPIPEPGTLILFGLGLVGLFYVRRTNTFNK